MEETKSTNKTNLSWLDNFLNKYWLYLVYAIIITCIFFISYQVAGAVPFGDATISTYDYHQQIAPFLEHIINFFKGDTSLFFSRNVLGGADVFQSLCFMVVSPFTILFLLFGSGNTYIAISFIIPLKVICIGWSAMYFIQKRFANVNSIAVFMMASVYGLCGYAISSNTYVIWMDLLIYFPFVVLGFKKLVDTGSVKMHAIATALMIYCSFSISSFSLFIIYPIYVIYVFMVVEKDKRKTVLTNITLSLVYAILASLPILLPNLISSSNSSRNTNLFSELNNSAEKNLRNMYTKLTYIFSDSIPLILGIFYLIRDRKSKIAKFLMVAGIIIMTPVVIDESCLLLNMGSYNSYALRFGFLNAFFAIFTCSMFLEKYTFKEWLPENVIPIKDSLNNTTENKANINTETNKQKKEMSVKEAFNSMAVVKFIKLTFKNKKMLYSVLATALLGGITIYFSYLLYKLFIISDDITYAEDFYRGNDNYSFKGMFTISEGGYNVIAWILLLAMIICILGYMLVKHKLITIKIFSCILAFFALGQTTFYVACIAGGHLSIKNNTEAIYDACIVDLKDTIDDFDYYRVKNYGWQSGTKWVAHDFSKNIQLKYNTKSIDTFSSNIDVRAFTASDYFNYTNTINKPGTAGGESHKRVLLGDSFLSCKYYFMADYQKSSNISHIGEEIIDLKDNHTMAEWGVEFSTYGIYENKYALPICFYTLSDSPLQTNSKDYFIDMQALFKFLGGEGNLFIEKSFVNDSSIGSITVNTNKIQLSINKPIEGEYFIYFDFESNSPIHFNYTFDNSSGVITYKRYGLGYTTKSSSSWDTVNVDKSGTLASMTDSQIKENIKVMIVDKTKLQQLATLAKSRIIKFKETRDGLKFNLDTSKILNPNNDDVYVYISNNFLDGSYIKVNNKKVENLQTPTGLTIFKLGNSGIYSVKTGYVSIYPILSVICAIVSAGLIIGLTILKRKTKILQNVILEKTIFFANIVLCVGILAFFFIYPTTLTIDKFLFKVDLWKIIAAK